MGFLNSTKAGRNGSERTRANNERMYRSAGGKWGMQPGYKSPAHIRAAYDKMPVDYKSPATSDGLEGIRAAWGKMQADPDGTQAAYDKMRADQRSLAQSDALERLRLENDAKRYGYDISTPLFDKIKTTLQQWVSNVGVWYSNLDKAFDKSNILHYVGLGSWARVGVAAVAAGGLAAAFYAWKKHRDKMNKQQGVSESDMPAYIPDFSAHIIQESYRMERAMNAVSMLLAEAGQSAEDLLATPGISSRINRMVKNIQTDASRAIQMLQKISADPAYREAPPEMQMQIQQLASVLETPGSM